MTRGRRVLVVALVAVVLVGAAITAAVFLVPSERIAAAAASRAEDMLGDRVAIDDVGLSFLPIGVRLSGISVGGSDAESAMAAVGSIELRARLLPLLRGEVVISSIELDRPRIVVDIDSAGRTNIPLLERDLDPEDLDGDEAGGAPTGRSVRFAVERVEVTDGRIGFRDARDGSVLRLDGWDQRLRIAGDFQDGELGRIELSGSVAFDDVDAQLPRVVVPVRDLAVRLTHDASFDRAADRIDLNSIGLALGGVSLTGSGAIDAASRADGRSATLGFQAEGIDAAALATWLPDSLRARMALPDGRRMEPTGIATLRLAINGPLTPGELPDFQGTLALADAGISVSDAAIARRVNGEAAFSADSVMARLTGVFLDEPFSAAVDIRQPATPTLAWAFDGRADLGRLDDLGVLPDSIRLQGDVGAEVRGLFPVHEPATATLSGTVTLDGIGVDGLAAPLAISAGSATFDGQSVALQGLAVRAGEAADLEVNATADGWIPVLLDSAAGPARISADITADTVDLDQLLGPSESEYPPLLFARLQDRPLPDGRAEDVAERAGLRLPSLPPVAGEIRFRAARIIRNGLAYSDVDATVRTSPDAVDLTDASFRFMGGTVRATGRFQPTERDSAGAPTRARLNGEFALQDVGAEPFFDRLTPFRDHLAGDLAMAGSLAMDLDRNMLPERPSVGVDGSLALSEGYLANWRVLQATAERLGLPAMDTVRFRDWAGAFRVTGPQITLRETLLEGSLLGARAAGSFGFDGALDLGATLYLPRELAARAGQIGERILAAAGTDDRVPVGVTIGGSVDRPDVALDLAEARENVVNRARAAAEQEARELADRAADAAMDRLAIPDSLRSLSPDSLRQVLGDSLSGLLPDSLRLQGDSLRARAEDEIRKRLRGIIPEE